MSSNVVQNKISSIDWNLSVKLAGNKPQLARDIVTMFAASLEDEINFIVSAKNNCKMDEVQRRVHKLHGAACYCGVPKLTALLATCESLLKKKLFADLDTYFCELMIEARKITFEAQLLRIA